MAEIELIYTDISHLAQKVVQLCTEKGRTVATAESCTGGMISGALTSISGSSAVIELGVCSYSNRIKNRILGVSEQTLAEFSEYSIKCAEEMAVGAARAAGSDYALSTTGVAGPSGGTDEHPVGEVFIGFANMGSVSAQRFVFSGNRDEVRASACCKALELLVSELEKG